MEIHAWITLGIIAVVIFGIVRDLAPPDVLFVGAGIALALLKIITPAQAVAGYANTGMLTIGAMFVIAAGLQETGVLNHVGDRMLGSAKTESQAMMRLAMVLIPFGGFVNNTPIVVMLMPVVLDFCRKRKISPSRLLIPLSFFKMLGGTCTLIGTSTNLVVNGLLVEASQRPGLSETLRAQLHGMSIFELTRAGAPYAIVGGAYLLLIGRKLLPDRKDMIQQLGESRREYLLEMIVQPGCRLIGQTIETAGLRHLEGLFLIEIDRQGAIIAPISPAEVIAENDRLVFTGVVGNIVELEKIPGLVPAADSAYEFDPEAQRGRRLCEAVISPSSPLIGKDIRNANFRALYNAAVVAVHRNSARLTTKVGDIVLRPGDTLLLQTGPNFAPAHRNNPDFYLVSNVEGSRPLRPDRAWIAGGIFVGVILAMSFRLLEPMMAAFTGAGLMVLLGCISPSDARQSIDWQVLVMIGGSIALGKALEESGAASTIATTLLHYVQPYGPVAVLAGLYLTAALLTEMVTHSASAVLMFPLCVEMARIMEVSPRPFVIALTLAASASFATPIGYPTNMLIYGPGGYRFSDFLRVGLPLNVLLWIVAVIVIPIFYPFR